MGPALTLAADEVQCPQTQWSPYKTKLLPPTHPRKVTLVTLGHMGGPTHPQVTKVTLFHVKRSLKGSTAGQTQDFSISKLSRMANMPQEEDSQTDYEALMEKVPTAAGNRLHSCYQ